MSETPHDLSVGDTSPEIVMEELERRNFVEYAGASGDFNPLHYDDTYAKEAGHQSVFGQGMLVASIASRVFTSWLGIRNIETFDVRFEAPVWPGESIVASATITGKTPLETGTRFDFDLVAETENGKTLLTGEAQARLPTEE